MMSEWSFEVKKARMSIRRFIRSINPVKLHYLENCVSCAACASACPYYPIEERYSPVNKAEELRKIYRKELTIAGKIAGNLFHAYEIRNENDVKRILEFAYRCSNCSRCYTMCPFGIDSGAMIVDIRGILLNIGYAPSLLRFLSDLDMRGELPESILKLWEETLSKVKGIIDTESIVERKGSDIIYIPSLIELVFYPEVIVDTISLLSKLNLKWTIPSKPMGLGMGMFIGDFSSVKTSMKKLNNYIKRLEIKEILLSDGGYLYPMLRFSLPEIVNEDVKYMITHIVEVLYDRLSMLDFITTEEKITWHSPCQLGRKGGVTREPLEILMKISSNFRRLPHDGLEAICCGGGGGMALLTREKYDHFRKLGLGFEVSEEEMLFMRDTEEAYKLSIREKMRDIERSGAEIVITSCPFCMMTLELGSKLYGPSIKVIHFSSYLINVIK